MVQISGRRLAQTLALTISPLLCAMKDLLVSSPFPRLGHRLGERRHLTRIHLTPSQG
ncbi:MAG TPA: hypothetical protein V6C65_04965 [Allocoleopsis sp.]